MTLRRWQILAFLAALLGGSLFLAGRSGCFREKPSKVEVRVDSTLAEAPAWQDTVRARDSVIAVRNREKAWLAKVSNEQRARADSAEAKATSLQQWADDLAEIPTNLSPAEENRMLRVALAAQKQAGVQFRLVVDSLKSQRTTDSLRMVAAEETIAEQLIWLAQDQMRINRLTKDLDDLRAETKKGEFWDLGFLPDWVDEALLATGGVVIGGVVGYQIGRAGS